jgi:hypothetical protein
MADSSEPSAKKVCGLAGTLVDEQTFLWSVNILSPIGDPSDPESDVYRVLMPADLATKLYGIRVNPVVWTDQTAPDETSDKILLLTAICIFRRGVDSNGEEMIGDEVSTELPEDVDEALERLGVTRDYICDQVHWTQLISEPKFGDYNKLDLAITVVEYE